ncbi:hypothetical protein AVEN_168302-1 [Araneus ventricosus]|uniref:Uncharacterized protein n=1 Tax=Araneus ventricosus TaxID=182803 RepID=A0A4Y2JAG2_ARAVE|nr:hypothetical protein AVEN_241305-1 [Araneus ventricosus]GBM87296.1 hypothetical protein AVEN_24722-1 [Araneus ventricosus]GBM87321.1 hypothetical protein AVEN_56175-1 [Araneus ventricosus]GBM87402.1 hypothetical protein AVEN_168302-1 [Araneus ventricosus]
MVASRKESHEMKIYDIFKKILNMLPIIFCNERDDQNSKLHNRSKSFSGNAVNIMCNAGLQVNQVRNPTTIHNDLELSLKPEVTGFKVR